MADFVVRCQYGSETSSTSGKRKRSANWTDLEKSILVDEYDKRKSIFSADFTTMVSTKTKQDAWASLVAAFQARSGSTRTFPEIKKKWENLLVMAKKKQCKESESVGVNADGEQCQDNPEGFPSFPGMGSQMTSFILEDLKSSCHDSHQSENSGFSDSCLCEDGCTQHSLSSEKMSPITPVEKLYSRPYTKDPTKQLYAEVLQLEKEKLQLEIELLKIKTKNAVLKNLKLTSDSGFNSAEV